MFNYPIKFEKEYYQNNKSKVDKMTMLWKQKELCKKNERSKPYYVKKENGDIVVDYVSNTGFINNYDVQMVLAPCDYEHLQKVENQLNQYQELLKQCYLVLEKMIDENDCRLDHHGYCQEHNWLYDSECPNKIAKNIMEKIKLSIGERIIERIIENDW